MYKECKNSSISKVPVWLVFSLWLVPIILDKGIYVFLSPQLFLLAFIENCMFFLILSIINIVVLRFIKNKSETYKKKTVIVWAILCIVGTLIRVSALK